MDSDFTSSFPYVHWLWQHIISRFEAGKLASGKLEGEDLVEAWNLHYHYGVVHHTKLEDEVMWPAISKLQGGKEVIAQLEGEHHSLSEKAEQIDNALANGDAGVDDLMREWADMYVAHIDLEEDLIIPLVRSKMPVPARERLSQNLRKASKSAPGGKMVLAIFQELSSHPVLGKQYTNSFPTFLRWAIIPVFARTDKLYAQHLRIFGSLKNAL